MPPNDREFGEFSARLDAVEDTLQHIQATVQEIRDDMLRAKGGWKALALVGGISATAGGIVVKILTAIGFPPAAPHP